MSVRSVSGYGNYNYYQPSRTRANKMLTISANDNSAVKLKKELINKLNSQKVAGWKSAKSNGTSSATRSSDDVKGYENWLRDGATKGYLQSAMSDLSTLRSSNTGSALNDYYLSQLGYGSGSGISGADSLKAWAMGQMNNSLMNLF